MSNDILERLAVTIRARRTATASGSSYTRQLLDAGPAGCAKKFGEEAIETVIAAASESEDKLKEEVADLLYHLLVLLESRSVSLEDVLSVLERRSGTSGLEEKSSRTQR